jgi:hypothetical protein
MELVNDTQHKVILEVLFGVVWLKRKNGTLDALSKNVRRKGLKINDKVYLYPARSAQLFQQS